MNNKLLACTVVLLTIFFNSAKAQSDSTKTDSIKPGKPRTPVMLIDTDNYDLGRMSMQKKFTQAVTIKASALEKLPFSSINEVINIYYNGIYADDKTFVYVVDGSLNTDVNAYSIYDIDELTII